MITLGDFSSRQSCRSRCVKSKVEGNHDNLRGGAAQISTEYQQKKTPNRSSFIKRSTTRKFPAQGSAELRAAPTGTRSSPRSGAPGAAAATIHSRPPKGHGEVARIHPRHRPEPALPYLLFRPDKPRRQRERGLGDRRLAGYRSGWLWDTFAMGAVGYTSQPLYAPSDKDGTTLLAPGQEGITVLGQAYGQPSPYERCQVSFGRFVDLDEDRSLACWSVVGVFGTLSLRRMGPNSFASASKVLSVHPSS